MHTLVFAGPNGTRHSRWLLTHNWISVFISDISCDSALVMTHMVADGHEYLVVDIGAILAIGFHVSIQALDNKN